MLRAVDKMLSPLKRRLRLLVTRGVVKLTNDAAKMQELQITGLADEVLDGVEHIQPYGFTAHPHPESDCLILNVGANRAHPIVIAVDDRRYRLKNMAEGEVAIYDDLNQRITLTRSGIVIDAPQGCTHNGDLTINGNTTINGDVSLTGTLTASTDVIAAGISLSGHTHPGDSGGTTGAPQ